MAAIGDVASSSRPQAPAVSPVATAARSRFATSSPSRAGAAKSSQPIDASPKSICCRLGSCRPIVGGEAAWSAFIVGSTWRSPQTSATSSTTRSTSPATSQERGAIEPTIPVTARQAPAIRTTPAASPSRLSVRSQASAAYLGEDDPGDKSRSRNREPEDA